MDDHRPAVFVPVAAPFLWLQFDWRSSLFDVGQIHFVRWRERNVGQRGRVKRSRRSARSDVASDANRAALMQLGHYGLIDWKCRWVRTLGICHLLTRFLCFYLFCTLIHTCVFRLRISMPYF